MALPTVSNITGWEHGVTPLSTHLGTGLCIAGTPSTDGGTISVQGTTKRTGSFALKVANAGAGTLTRVGYTHGAVNGISVGRVYVYFDTLPTAAAGTYVKFMQVGVNDAVKHGTWEVDQTGALRVSISSDTYQSYAGPAIVTARWYRMEWYFDSTTTTYTHQWAVDGWRQTTVSKGSMTADTTSEHRWYPSCQSDTNAHNVGSFIFDDMCLSRTAADFPIGGGQVVGIYTDQSAAAEHQSITATQWQTTPDFSAFTNFTGAAETTARGFLDDLTMTDGIRLNGGASGQAGNARWPMADPSPDPNTPPNDARGIVVALDASLGTNNLRVGFWTSGGSTNNVINGDPGGATATYTGTVVGGPGVTWTAQGVRDLRLEIDSSDSTPAIHVGGVILEIDYRDVSSAPNSLYQPRRHLIAR